ncbi:MAG TPA: carboxymuconolactone decarboxylase family protein [Solirubrobacteraceae bacterium]|jgi:alkylhydroperoxidase family enzyme|nr:carboxymuconolactone decarboxylase family protein [Solirubrobacteraceae bacterium]
MARIPPLTEAEWDEQLAPTLGARQPGLRGRLGDNNIFSTLARHPRLMRAWLPFGGFLLGRGVLPARERELLILRTACNCSSPYEWGQHVRISEALGIDREEILRVALGPDAEGWSAAERTLLRGADELHRDSKISEGTWAQLAEDHDQRALIELAMLVGHYHMVAYALNSLEVDLDEGLEPLPRA